VIKNLVPRRREGEERRKGGGRGANFWGQKSASGKKRIESPGGKGLGEDKSANTNHARMVRQKRAKIRDQKGEKKENAGLSRWAR